MAYEKLDRAFRQLKTDRERAEASENAQKKRVQKPGSGSHTLSPQ